MTYPQKTLFVSFEYFKAMTPLNDQVDDNLISPCMLLAQDKYLAPYLGDALYEKLAADIPSPTGEYLTLMQNYVIDVVVWGTMLELTPNLAYRYNNGTLSQHESEDSSPVSDDIMKDMIARAKHNLNHYTERLADYLCSNSSLLPEYSSNTGSQRCPIKYRPGGTTYLISDGRSATGRSLHILNRYLP